MVLPTSAAAATAAFDVDIFSEKQSLTADDASEGAGDTRVEPSACESVLRARDASIQKIERKRKNWDCNANGGPSKRTKTEGRVSSRLLIFFVASLRFDLFPHTKSKPTDRTSVSFFSLDIPIMSGQAKPPAPAGYMKTVKDIIAGTCGA